MGVVEINDPHGFETVFSTDPDSPAAPYLREHHLERFEDLYELGMIPNHIEVEHLRSARDEALAAATPFISFDTTRDAPEENRRAEMEARSASQAQDSVVQAMARSMIYRHGYQEAEAVLSARKVLSFGDNLKNAILVMLTLEDTGLEIRTPLVIRAGIHSLLARDVTIFKGGTLRIDGSYFHVRYNSIKGGIPWWKYPVASEARHG